MSKDKEPAAPTSRTAACPKCKGPAARSPHATIAHLETFTCLKCGPVNVPKGQKAAAQSEETKKLPPKKPGEPGSGEEE